ncbi:MAG: hypothetical protein CMN91_00760 [Synechococcus sp. ARS1019]|nr:hypothetical protein [Synechococcus sp. ARS1019]
MFSRLGSIRALIAGGVALASALALQGPVKAGFSPEQLAGFEVTHLRGLVSVVLPDQKVIEVIDPEGHKQIVTVGFDMSSLALKPGDGVDVSVLDGLVVDLALSSDQELSFNREDIIMPSTMGPLPKGTRVALASGTARVLKLSSSDRSISLMGPLGGIHNLDVIANRSNDLFPNLKPGDLVDFRLIQPVAVALDRVKTTKAVRSVAGEQPMTAALREDATTIQADLLQSFEITKLQGTITRLQSSDQVLELRSPYGHEMLITSGVDLKRSGIKVGDKVQVDLLDGLIVDLKRSPRLRLSFQRQDVILSQDFGPVREGARVAMGTGTAEVVKISEKDQDLSLRGPFGGIHNLDIRDGIKGNPLQTLHVGDYVEFRAIQPVAIAVRKLN